MTSLELLVELDDLSFPARQKRIAQLGRDPKNAPLWDELERGNSFERRLAIQSCASSRDGERVLRMVGDVSRLVRGLALEMVALGCEDAQIARVWPLLNRASTKKLLQKLKKRRRQSAIDAFLQAQFSQKKLDEGLVALASSEVAARLLESSFERASDEDFKRLASLQARVTLEKALEIARELTAPDGAALKKCNAVLGAAWAFGRADEKTLAFDLVRELNRVFPLQKIELDALIDFGQAQKVAELILASGEKTTLDFSHRAHKLSIDWKWPIRTRATTRDRQRAYRSIQCDCQRHQIDYLLQCSRRQSKIFARRFGRGRLSNRARQCDEQTRRFGRQFHQ